ncbi:MAG: hypothetical protein KTR31_26620 [Myxococcales bacterium]|nr:hypothetical protein [Myxococcales bacterium]
MITALLAAQLATPALAKDSNGGIGLWVGTEALTPFMGGFHVELGLGFNKTRISASTTWVERPAFLTPGQDYTEYRRYADVHLTHFLGKGQRGFNIGGGVTVFYDVDITQIGSDEKLDAPTFGRVAARAGYALFPSKKLGLYIEPAIVAGLAVGVQDIEFTDLGAYNTGLIDVSGPLLLVGWRFGLTD